MKALRPGAAAAPALHSAPPSHPPFRPPGAHASRRPMTLDIYWRRAIALTVGLWLFVGVIYLPILFERHADHDVGSIALDFSTVFVSMLVALPLYIVFRHTLDWRSWQRGLMVAASVATAAVVQTLFDFQFSAWVASSYVASWSGIPHDLTRFYGAMFNYVCVFGVNVALFNLSASRIRAMEAQQDLAAARQAAQAAQLAALRYQLNPHFLFNTLNAISSMIVTRRNDEAEQMTGKLAAFLRASLATETETPVPLEEELAMVQDYLDIESIRFPERLSVRFDCSDDAAPLLVPGFILQPLVENAVKYGVARSRGRVTITLRCWREGDVLRLAVADDAALTDDAVDTVGTGKGLDNVRRRLEALYGAAARLVAGPSEGGWRAEIDLPARMAA